MPSKGKKNMEVIIMTKLNSTAKKIDTFFKFFATLLNIAGITLLVGLAIIGAAFLFDLDPAMVGHGYNTVNIGFMKLRIAEAYAPDPRHVLKVMAAQLVLALVVCFVTRFCIKCMRQILQPMVDNKPFDSTVSTNLKKLAKYALIAGIAVNVIELLSSIALIRGYDLDLLIIHEKIPHAEFQYTFDFGFLLVWGILLLLSYVFRYGEELQQLSDETL